VSDLLPETAVRLAVYELWRATAALEKILDSPALNSPVDPEVLRAFASLEATLARVRESLGDSEVDWERERRLWLDE
jgi:hypothetical protein